MKGIWNDGPPPVGVEVGEGAVLEWHDKTFKRFFSTRDPGLVIGPRVKIYTWSEFGVEPDGLLTVGADSILVGASIMCAERVEIGERVVISYDVTITDCDFHPLEPVARRRDAEAITPEGDPAQRAPLTTRPVVIEDGAWIGIGATILKGVRVGAGARVEAGAVVAKDVPPGARAIGNPAEVQP